MERLRLKVQLLSAALLNLGVAQLHFICFPVLNCHSCPTSIFACPLGVIGQFAAVGLVPLSVIGTIAVVGLFAGRIFCGWVCPFGFVQDLLYKVPYIKFSIPRWTRFIKYGVFVGLVVAVPVFLSTEFPLYFCRLCPVATVESALPWAIIRGSADVVSLSIRLAILFGILVLAMGHHRFFCKVLCPLGACLSVFNRFAAIFPERNADCVDCGTCSKVCPMETKHDNAARFGVYDNRAEECISCLECRKKCPTQAIKLWGQVLRTCSALAQRSVCRNLPVFDVTTRPALSACTDGGIACDRAQVMPADPYRLRHSTFTVRLNPVLRFRERLSALDFMRGAGDA